MCSLNPVKNDCEDVQCKKVWNVVELAKVRRGQARVSLQDCGGENGGQLA